MVRNGFHKLLEFGHGLLPLIEYWNITQIVANTGYSDVASTEVAHDQKSRLLRREETRIYEKYEKAILCAILRNNAVAPPYVAAFPSMMAVT